MADRYLLRLSNLGRTRILWCSRPKDEFPLDDVIIQTAIREGMLLSRDLDVVWLTGSPEEGKWTGKIYAGMNCVGEFEVEHCDNQGLLKFGEVAL